MTWSACATAAQAEILPNVLTRSGCAIVAQAEIRVRGLTWPACLAVRQAGSLLNALTWFACANVAQAEILPNVLTRSACAAVAQLEILLNGLTGLPAEMWKFPRLADGNYVRKIPHVATPKPCDTLHKIVTRPAIPVATARFNGLRPHFTPHLVLLMAPRLWVWFYRHSSIVSDGIAG